jgi:Bax protein
MFPIRHNPARTLVAMIVVAASSPLAAGELPALDTWRFKHPVETLHVAGVGDLEKLFAAKDYRLTSTRADKRIPRLYLRRLVEDLHTVEPVRNREAIFIRIVLPLVMRANTEILAQRRLLEIIADRQAGGASVTPAEQTWLRDLARLYGGRDEAAALLERVDMVPPSLAIAQAIDESAWGTAHLALESNGMFGEHAPPSLARGRIKVAGANVDVAAFPTLLDGVLAYMTNINRNRAYAELRALRAEHRRAGKALDGYALAEGLIHYSQRGAAYVETLRRLIRRHELQIYDSMKLASGGAVLIHASR